MSVLSFKPFFVHEHRVKTRQEKAHERQASRGCTTFVEPSGKDRLIKVRTVFCSSSRNDHFCKRKGREEVLKIEPIEINSRELPKYLAFQATKVFPDYVDFSWYNWFYKFMV